MEAERSSKCPSNPSRHIMCVHHSAIVVLNMHIRVIVFFLSGHSSLCVLISSVCHVAETKHTCVCDCCDCSCAWSSVHAFFIQIDQVYSLVSSQPWQNGGYQWESRSSFIYNCKIWFVLFIWRQMKSPTIQKQMVPGEMRKDQLTDGHPHSLSQVWICVCVCVCIPSSVFHPAHAMLISPAFLCTFYYFYYSFHYILVLH